jgi:predicted metal-binding protein
MPPLNAQTNRLSQAIQQGLPVETRRNNVLAQMICCQGCCCGRTDRGFPPLPVEMLKEKWKSQKLNNTIQLTISGCLGPCDAANVVCLMFNSGETVWLGGLTLDQQYQQLLEWAEQCHSSGSLLPAPPDLRKHIFRRFEQKNDDGQQCFQSNSPILPFGLHSPEAVVQSTANATMI